MNDLGVDPERSAPVHRSLRGRLPAQPARPAHGTPPRTWSESVWGSRRSSVRIGSDDRSDVTDPTGSNQCYSFGSLPRVSAAMLKYFMSVYAPAPARGLRRARRGYPITRIESPCQRARRPSASATPARTRAAAGAAATRTTFPTRSAPRAASVARRSSAVRAGRATRRSPGSRSSRSSEGKTEVAPSEWNGSLSAIDGPALTAWNRARSRSIVDSPRVSAARCIALQ